MKDESEQLGLSLNVTKTKLMAISRDCMEIPLMVDGQKVEFVSQFNFLGSLITKEGGCGQEIWADRGITRATKLRLV